MLVLAVARTWTRCSPDIMVAAVVYIIEQQKEYLSAAELQRMRLSPGSSLLAALPESLSLWTADDWGIDEQGFYELVIASDRCPGAEYLSGEETNGGDTAFCSGSASHDG